MMRQKTLPTFETGAATHPGKVRSRNEDSFIVRPETGVWAVADGMGGHEAGDLASQTIVKALAAIPPPSSAPELLRHCEERMVEANARLLQIANERGGIVIGSTVAVLLTFQTNYACVWSGDSRVYLLRGNDIIQISRDHTQVQQLVEDGVITSEEARHYPGRNVITRAIGVSDEPELELTQGTLRPGDTFIICSDGLTGHVTDSEINEHVNRRPAQIACDALINLTLERGALDNVTLVIARYQPWNSTAVRGVPGWRG